eukprot:scaffold79482_cov69-Phaeocystis_antarctica.AAC.6
MEEAIAAAQAAKAAEQEDAAPTDDARAKRQRLEAPAGMLSTLGMPQDEYSASLAECMRERLLQLIPKLSANKLGQLLDASFEHIQTPGYDVIVAALLQHTTELSPAVISALADPERQLLPLVPMQCRHRVWTEKPDLFIQETHGHILDYTEQAKVHRPDLLGLDSTVGQHRRAASSGVQELLKLIGSRSLYAALMNLLADIYKHTDDGLLAALRCSMDKVPLWLSRLSTPRESPGHCMHSHRLGCSSWPPPRSLILPPLALQALRHRDGAARPAGRGTARRQVGPRAQGERRTVQP